MDEEIKNALIYGSFAAVGLMLLYTSSINEILTTSWIGALLFIYGLVVAIFFMLEYASPSDEYQEVVTIILLSVLVGISMMNFGIDVLKIVGATALSIALGRAFALAISLVIDLLSPTF